MNLDKVSSLVYRTLFGASFVLLAVAVIDRLAELGGYVLLPSKTYTAGRLVEFAGIFQVFVITMLLRQLREILKKTQ